MAQRFVIKHPTKGYFAHFETVETKAVVSPADIRLPGFEIKKGDAIGVEDHKAPVFIGHIAAASKYGDAASAQAHIDGDLPEFHGGKDAFAGCIVETIEV